MLVDGTGDRQGLAQRYARQCGQQGVEFRGGGAVALDAAVGLLEHQAGE